MSTPEHVISTAPEAEVLVDTELLASLASIPDLYQETVKLVNEQITRMHTLRSQSQLSAQQVEEFGDLAHRLKSGMCMVGARRLSLVCNKLGWLDYCWIVMSDFDSRDLWSSWTLSECAAACTDLRSTVATRPSGVMLLFSTAC